jgi:hypothetical protein
MGLLVLEKIRISQIFALCEVSNEIRSNEIRIWPGPPVKVKFHEAWVRAATVDFLWLLYHPAANAAMAQALAALPPVAALYLGTSQNLIQHSK